MKTIGIIGTAGRGEDLAKLNLNVFERMVNDVITKIGSLNVSLKDIRLVSGGAAWSDHIAVMLFNSGKFGGLTLHLPAAWMTEGFVNQGDGKSANRYHYQFQEKIGIDSFGDIEKAIGCGTEINVWEGFMARNVKVGQCDVLIALTFGTDGLPGSSGTLNTWNRSTASEKIHIQIK